MPDGGFASSYLPALSRLLGEVEQPTDTKSMMSPQFGGSPEQLQGILQHPQVQSLMQQLGIHYDPSQMRQSPFFSNQFMQGHPQLGGALTGGMAAMAATPKADMVQGFGQGLTNMAQGAAGGPEMLRQYQIRQMMAPMQAMGAMIPGQEFQRKQQLMTLLEQMEKDRAQQANRQQSFREQQPTKTPYGLMMPGAQVPPEMTGQPEHTGSQPLFEMFKGQGQQQFPAQGSPYFQPYDPKMIQQQSEAKNPLPFAKAEESRAETKGGMAGAKVDETRSKADRNRALAGKARKDAGGKQADPAQISKQYNDAEKQYRAKEDELAQRRQLDPKDPKRGHLALDDAGYKAAQAENLAALQQSKANIDQAQGQPGTSSRGERQGRQRKGLVSPGAQQPGGQQNLQKDEAGHIWDMSDPDNPQLVQQAPPQQ